MSYKLLITYSIEVEPRLKVFIGLTDAVRGEPCSLSFAVTNIGTETFPGGNLENIDLSFNNIAQQTWKPEPGEWSCPPLIIGEKKELAKVVTLPITDGVAWITLNFRSQDNQPVEYFHEDKKESRPIWQGCIYVVNREILLTLAKLSTSSH